MSKHAQTDIACAMCVAIGSGAYEFFHSGSFLLGFAAWAWPVATFVLCRRLFWGQA